MSYGIEGRPAADDDIHQRLAAIIEVPHNAYLWVPADAIDFTPRVLPIIYGDGRALFRITTINDRPRWWMIRGCSTWGCGDDRDDAAGPDFGELTDDILTDMEGAFGNARCSYSGSSLRYPRDERIQWCQCEECDDEETLSAFPEVDGNGGCSWSRTDWPKDFDTVPNPLSAHGKLLSEPSQ
ncbi:hypothetical protein [Brevundimonas sp.]|uniref:hypothetical protein n=1 Tax=Brevundimonas sp. TaxID=1871086 RepID=UPI0025C4FD33|nr:hypothetical protein [Brevundimonas sp.]